MTDNSDVFLESCRFWIQRVLVPIAVCIGVGGNVISIIVLTRRRMRSSTNIYLTALAVADLIYLLFVLILSFQHYPNIHHVKYSLFWRFYGISHWFCDAASSTSVWLTVSFTIERYVAVCHPIRGKIFCTEKRAKTVIWVVSLLCFILTASTPLEHQLKLEKNCNQTFCPLNINQSLAWNVTENFSKLNATDDDLGRKLNNSINVITKDDGISEREARNLLNKGADFVLISKNKRCDENINLDDNLERISRKDDDETKEKRTIKSNSTLLNNKKITMEENKNTNCGKNSNVTIAENTSLDEDLFSSNENCCSVSINTEYTKLGKNETYLKVYWWFSSIMFGLLPLFLIAIFNCFLVNAVYKSLKRRKVMTNSQERMSQSQENRITLLLIGVVGLFLICQTPTASLLIYNAITEKQVKPEYSENIKKGLGNIFNFLITLNASCNFVLYCVLSDKFRRTFKIVFCNHGLNRQDTLITLTGNSRYASQRFHSQRNLIIKRATSEYAPVTPRNLETQSLNSIPRTKSLVQRQLGKAKTRDLHV